MITEGTLREYCERKARIVCEQHLISLICLMNPFIRFSIFFRWYAFPNFCTHISRPHAFGVRTSSKARATAGMGSANPTGATRQTCCADSAENRQAVSVNLRWISLIFWNYCNQPLTQKEGPSLYPNLRFSDEREKVKRKNDEPTHLLAELVEAHVSPRSCPMGHFLRKSNLERVELYT